MAKETKVGLLIGLALILLVGIILSDLVSGPDKPTTTAQEQAAGFGPQAQHNIYPPQNNDSVPRRLERAPRAEPDASPPAVPDAFRTQPAFGQQPSGDGAAPRRSLILPPPAVEADRALAPPPSRRPNLPEPNTREAATPRVTELPQAWRVDRAALKAPQPVKPEPTIVTTLRPDPAISVTPDDGSFFIPPPPVAHDTSRFHLVGPRESLASVARKHYGDPAFAAGLGQANPGLVGFGGTLRPGDRLVLPERSSPLFAARPTPAVAPTPTPPPTPEAVPSTPPQRATADAPAGTVTAAAGDTLSGLAVRHLGSGQRWDELLAANPDVLKRPEQLRVGMVLRLPAAAPAPQSPAPTAALRTPEASPAPVPANTYTVKAGDNLTRIAARALGDGQRWDELFAANRDQLENPGQVRVGMVLQLPNSAPATGRAAAPQYAAPTSVTTYTVKAGDNLTRIAARALGDGQRWDELFAANRDILDAPESIRVGQVLRMP